MKNVRIDELVKQDSKITISMITQLMNYHRQLTNAPKKFWQTDEESRKDLNEWLETGKIYNIFIENKIVGFMFVRFGGQNVAWLEDIFIIDGYRQQGIGKLALNQLDQSMISLGVLSLFVDVIPRNRKAIKLYQECGFDHLNMIQLRKNYDINQNKKDEINLLGFTFKQY